MVIPYRAAAQGTEPEREGLNMIWETSIRYPAHAVPALKLGVKRSDRALYRDWAVKSGQTWA